MRIIIEDEELEHFVMEGNSCIGVPVEITEHTDGETVVTVYSAFKKDAEEYAFLFKDDPFSEKALSFLKERFEKPMAEAGYTFDSKADHLIYNYKSERESLSNPLCNTVFIDTNAEFEKYYNDATRDIELDDDDACDVCFAVIDGGCIVSFAAVNDISDDDSFEINVETAPHARKKGYGMSCVVSLCDYLLSKGEKVSYKCRHGNIASRRLAEKAGLVFTGKTYSFVCYND